MKRTAYWVPAVSLLCPLIILAEIERPHSRLALRTAYRSAYPPSKTHADVFPVLFFDREKIVFHIISYAYLYSAITRRLKRGWRGVNQAT